MSVFAVLLHRPPARRQARATTAPDSARVPASASGIPGWCDIERPRVRVVFLGVDHELFRPRGGGRNATLLLYPAARWPNRNHAALFESFRLLRSERPNLQSGTRQCRTMSGYIERSSRTVGDMRDRMLLRSTPLGRFLEGRRVLVTGHTGLVGTWLCRWLVESGAEPVGFARRATDRASGVRGIAGDIRCRADVAAAVTSSAASVVIHSPPWLRPAKGLSCVMRPTRRTSWGRSTSSRR
jgi:hypothetical protein